MRPGRQSQRAREEVVRQRPRAHPESHKEQKRLALLFAPFLQLHTVRTSTVWRSRVT